MNVWIGLLLAALAVAPGQRDGCGIETIAGANERGQKLLDCRRQVLDDLPCLVCTTVSRVHGGPVVSVGIDCDWHSEK